MTLIIRPGSVTNTDSTSVSMGNAWIKVGGDLINQGDMSLHNTDLEVANNLIQSGKFKVNDPQVFANTVLEIAKTGKNVTEFGVRILKLLTSNQGLSTGF